MTFSGIYANIKIMDIISLALLFSSLSKELDLPKNMLSSICYIESTHNIKAINKDDGNSPSLGVCQIKLETARTLGFKGTKEQLMRPKTNIYYAAKYLKKQLNRYNGNAMKAVAAYNSGTYKQNTDGLPMNKKYVSKVFNKWLK